jgi:hypothetical protein
MKNLLYILIFWIVCADVLFAQSSTNAVTDSSKNPKKGVVKLIDSNNLHKITTDKFVDSDGDGINDCRSGRGMGLGESLGKHKCVPIKTVKPKKSKAKEIKK